MSGPTPLTATGLLVFVLTMAGIAASCQSPEAEPAAPASTTTITTEPPNTTPPSTTVVSPGLTALDLCAATSTGGSASVESPQLTEVSGIVSSRQHDGIIWAHNDSGGGAFVYAIEPDGRDLGTWSVDASSLDWEDIALVATAEGDQLVVGDIGNNFHLRTNGRLVRLAEPANLESPGALTADTITVSYPDGQPDAETLLIDPKTLEVVIVARDTSGTDHAIYTASLPETGSAELELVKAGSVPTDEFVSGGDLSPDRSLIALRTPSTILVWNRIEGASMAESLAQPPACSTEPAQPEIQGEAIAFLASGTGLVTISEGQFPAINVVAVGG